MVKSLLADAFNSGLIACLFRALDRATNPAGEPSWACFLFGVFLALTLLNLVLAGLYAYAYWPNIRSQNTVRLMRRVATATIRGGMAFSFETVNPEENTRTVTRYYLGKDTKLNPYSELWNILLILFWVLVYFVADALHMADWRWFDIDYRPE